MDLNVSSPAVEGFDSSGCRITIYFIHSYATSTHIMCKMPFLVHLPIKHNSFSKTEAIHNQTLITLLLCPQK